MRPRTHDVYELWGGPLDGLVVDNRELVTEIQGTDEHGAEHTYMTTKLVRRDQQYGWVRTAIHSDLVQRHGGMPQ